MCIEIGSMLTFLDLTFTRNEVTNNFMYNCPCKHSVVQVHCPLFDLTRSIVTDP